MTEMTLERFKKEAEEKGIHTVEVATPDTYGHLRGKRVPYQRFVDTTITAGINIANAMFAFDIQNGLPEHPYISMESGYLDCKLVPEIGTARFLSHRPGYAIVFADVLDVDGSPLSFAPRNVLRHQIDNCNQLGLDPFVATELEFYLLNPDLTPIQDYIQYSTLTDGLELESVIADMRNAVADAGIEIESSNPEYGPGQFEINCGPANAMRTADSTVLFKSIIKQIATRNGLVASFMPKPMIAESGSGMHIHISLTADGKNAFADSDHKPNEVMGQWLAGELKNAQAMTLLGIPSPNGYKRLQPYSFAPTHVHWGGDNRSVLARCIIEPGSAANRIEYRNGGADANPHLLIAGLLAAGSEGVEQKLSPPPMSEGDMYADPGDCPEVPHSITDAIEAYEGSDLADRLGEEFSNGYVAIVKAEADLGRLNAPDPDAVVEWELKRYAEHT